MSSCVDYRIKQANYPHLVTTFLCSLDVTWKLQTHSCHVLFIWSLDVFHMGDWIAGCVRGCMRRREEIGFLPDGYSRLWAGWWSRRFTREGLYLSSCGSPTDERLTKTFRHLHVERRLSTTCTAVSHWSSADLQEGLSEGLVIIVNHRLLSYWLYWNSTVHLNIPPAYYWQQSPV